MTYDDWKTTDDTPAPDPNRCEKCGHPEGYCDCPCCVEPDQKLTPEQWKAQEERISAEQEAHDEAFDRFREDAEEFLQNAAAADTHSSDVDPGDFPED